MLGEFRAGATVLAIGVLTVLAAQYLGVRNPQALSRPVPRDGLAHSSTFRPEFSGQHEIRLESDHRAAPCVGPPTPPGAPAAPPAECEARPETDLDWRLRQGARVLAADGRSPSRRHPGGHILGRVVLREGEPYRLDFSAPREAGPPATLVVDVHPSAWKDEFVWRMLLALCGFGVGAVGALMVLVQGVRRIVRAVAR